MPKTVWISDELHDRLKAECKSQRPKVNLGDKAEVLIEDGLNRVKTVCAWCHVLMHDGREPVSHGICMTCAEKHFGKYMKGENNEPV